MRVRFEILGPGYADLYSNNESVLPLFVCRDKSLVQSPFQVFGLNLLRRKLVLRRLGVASRTMGVLDAEWASAAAPSAAILLALCADTTTTLGVLIALQNLIDASSQPPAVVSISYGECETQNEASSNAAYNATYQQRISRSGLR